ncbi:ferredoxin-thioredoxin reductase, variable chain-like [Lotus japonicus]|uniref:Ferredoxin thioredoxin reductase alpha chain domain-containing protein n=1 Tax=Lotus japonicus TaxID=34305 RepID=I3T384_LOTJA|nr:ferredoxin-thioredoxin reductase, variable chain-like [Lotus japonicus]AFK46976.1 unknown [Lotus japonicus]
MKSIQFNMSTIAIAMAPSSPLLSVSPNRSSMLLLTKSIPFSSSSSIHPPLFANLRGSSRSITRCEVAVEESSPSSTSSSSESEEAESSKVGARVRVKVPLKVYHVPKVPEFDLEGAEGEIKQYVALWKGKKISANFPYKVQFVTEIEGRGAVKFFAHLKEDEFEFL